MHIVFPPFTLDLDTRQLTRGDTAVHLEPKAFELLAALVMSRSRAVSKADLQQRLWPNTFVAEANVSNLVAALRATLGDSARAPRFIRTVHGFGYAFCGNVTPHATSMGRTAQRPPCWLEWGRRRFPLGIGEHVIGRDPDLPVRVDSATVSRRHARIVVTAEGAVLEDFVSKNGTFHGSDRVTAPTPLVDGDDIRIGAVLLTFRSTPLGASTETHAAGPA